VLRTQPVRGPIVCPQTSQFSHPPQRNPSLAIQLQRDCLAGPPLPFLIGRAEHRREIVGNGNGQAHGVFIPHVGKGRNSRFQIPSEMARCGRPCRTGSDWRRFGESACRRRFAACLSWRGASRQVFDLAAVNGWEIVNSLRTHYSCTVLSGVTEWLLEPPSGSRWRTSPLAGTRLSPAHFLLT